MLESKAYLVEVNSVATLELDLLIEHLLLADSYFISINQNKSANLFSDCADITVLLLELIKRKSSVEIKYLNLCIEVWNDCRKILSDFDADHKLKDFDLCLRSNIRTFTKYSFID